MANLHPQSAHSHNAPDSQFSKPSSLAPSSKETEGFFDPAAKQRDDERARKKKRNIWIGAGILTVIVILAVVIPVAVTLSNNSSNSNGSGSGTGSGDTGAIPGVKGKTPAGTPAQFAGTYYDTSTWYTTEDFNTTFTDEKVGGLPVMGLFSKWDDSARANPNVPALNEKWDYGKVPFRGTNLGGHLCLEPFLTPSFWDIYPASMGIIDEWTLSKHLGPQEAKSKIEKHYATFASEEDFKQIAAAGFDHVRIPFSYWAVKVYGDDPYVPMVSFRYMLRDIEWARKYGLRIFLDLHAVPGSQNGWVHSGKIGAIDWLKGPDGALNGERTLEIHQMLSTFFTQPRYKNIITLYGLVNEPYMPDIGTTKVVDWYKKAIPIIRKSGYDGLIIMSDGFDKPAIWSTGIMQGYEDLVMDIHQYIVYDDGTLGMIHQDKINYACEGFQEQAQQWTQAFGPTMYGEWSYADTECALYQNGVNVGSRWNGTYDNDPPACIAGNGQCDCGPAIADPKTFSQEYKLFLRTFLLAQMDSFDDSWGWFHWTWKADDLLIAPSWTYTGGLAAGIVPKTIQDRTWNCAMDIPDFAGAGLSEMY